MSVRVAALVDTAGVDTVLAAGARPGAAPTLPWQLFICRACGLIYDEAVGDPDSGLAPGTRFADIPDDWACPLCGVTKADFEPYIAEPAATRRTAPTRAQAATQHRHDAGTVIVGAGRAGWQMAEALRAQDPSLPITLVTACDGDVYDKPLLSVAMARGITPARLPRERGADAAQRLRIRLLPHTHAVRIDVAGRSLRTSRGALRYRHLVLAHGAQSRQLPALPAQLCWHINHLQAYAAFRATLGDVPQRVTVVGAGLIGCELANDLALAGHRVTLLDLQNRPLAAALTPVQSQQLLAAWQGLPLVFCGGVQVHDVRVRTGGKELAALDGRVFTTDHIVVAAGLQTPSRLARSADLTWNNGVAVDPDTLATSQSGIYALGDCISIGGEVSRYIEPIGRQARTVAAGILGLAVPQYQRSSVPVRVKTTSLPFTLQAKASGA